MSTITTIAGSDNISTSDTVINTNFTNLNTDKIETSYLDTDTSLAANSDVKIATQKAVKTYIDTSGGANASETVRGIVEEATDAEVAAGTATGGTGAKLFITPAKLKAITSPVVRTYLNAGSPATWTKPSGLKYVIVEVQAGGATGGGGGANNNDRGAGGGAGGYSRKLIPVDTLGTTETVTTGGTDGASSFGSHATAATGSTGANATSGIILGGAGGAGASGDVNVTGFKGDNALSYDGAVLISGRGANSKFGVGGVERTSSGAGNAASGYGSGGGGGWGTAGNPISGGAGGAGIVIVTEHYS